LSAVVEDTKAAEDSNISSKEAVADGEVEEVEEADEVVVEQDVEQLLEEE
jgi:hypothetical protein